MVIDDENVLNLADVGNNPARQFIVPTGQGPLLGSVTP